MNAVFYTSKDSKKFMFDELLKDGWRWNEEGELERFVAKCKLIKPFNSNIEAREYFKLKYPKLSIGCSCDECDGDFELYNAENLNFLI